MGEGRGDIPGERAEGSRHRGKGMSLGERMTPPGSACSASRCVGGRATGDEAEGPAPPSREWQLTEPQVHLTGPRSELCSLHCTHSNMSVRKHIGNWRDSLVPKATYVSANL